VTPDPTVRATRYEVSCLPEDHEAAPHFTITVEWRGNDQWAVTRYGDCFGTDGEWDYEPRPSSRTDEWKNTHRFDLATALDLAKQQAQLITVRGKTAADLLKGTPDDAR
jgi:hypothetical protein